MTVRDIHLNYPVAPSALSEVNLCFVYLVCYFFAEIHDHPSFLVANANTDNFSWVAGKLWDRGVRGVMWRKKLKKNK